ncbi:PREDICTED: uncharacterized protein LOC109228610 [Nicotiana attenuata]|uniref:DUF7894 domain-containing protein n=1 Tax=Nicotiana attenuata TaxID=49451 RepID=A0A1J6I6D7_NICAT|nr:PREDICTED: uncharacterized protein LOC109228610 [Nicotiana attenuata]OIT00028.1 hypothetical protein A4A49_02626 [Nicotiana attenuata]
MKVAPKVILLFRDSSGFGTAIFEALQPNPNSNFQKRQESLDLSLERYGIKDQKVSVEIVHFLDGSNQVSVLLLENYEPPTLACALNEVLSMLVGDGSSNMPTIVAPFLVADTKLKMENRTSLGVDNISVYGLQVGASSGLTKALVTNLRSPPPSLQIFHEQLACLLQLVRVLNLPTLVIIGRKGRKLHRKTSEEELEVIHEIGQHLASFSSLNFSAEKIAWDATKSSRETQEPWRALYG